MADNQVFYCGFLDADCPYNSNTHCQYFIMQKWDDAFIENTSCKDPISNGATTPEIAILKGLHRLMKTKGER